MKTVLCSTVALTLSLTVPMTAGAAANGVHHGGLPHRMAHVWKIPAGAEAFSSRPATIRTVETDGLSRDVNACNFGCIDNY